MQFNDVSLNFAEIQQYLRKVGVDEYVVLAKSWLSNLLTFTEFQTSLLKAFLLIYFIVLVLIVAYWRKYGGIITDRFIRASTLKEIEELRASVARLKLPREHTPRI